MPAIFTPRSSPRAPSPALRIDCATAGLVSHFGLILCQSLGEAFGFGLKPSDGLLLFFNNIQQLLDRQLAVASVGSQLACIDAGDVYHFRHYSVDGAQGWRESAARLGTTG